MKVKQIEQPTGIKCNGVKSKINEISAYTVPRERRQVVTIGKR